jgi:hypothetical protein
MVVEAIGLAVIAPAGSACFADAEAADESAA